MGARFVYLSASVIIRAVGREELLYRETYA